MNAVRIVRNGLVLGIQDFKAFWKSWPVWLFAHGLRVVTTAATFVLLGRLVESEALVRFLVIGQVAIVGPGYAGWALQSFTWDRYLGTFPLLIAAPSGLAPAMIGRTAVWLLNGVATSILALAVLVPTFGLSLPVLRVPLAVVILAILCFSMYSFCFWLGTLITWAARLRNIVQNVAVILVTAICGPVVPVEFWPAGVQAVAHVLPITHGLGGLRTLLAGGPYGEVTSVVLLESMVGFAWLGLGVLTLDRTVGLARRRGALELA